MKLDPAELRRIYSEGYTIRTDSDLEDFGETEDFDIPPSLKKHAMAISVFGGPVRDDQGNPFPARWGYWCHYCCHPFTTAPFGIPTKYDEYRDRYFCIGRYCSDSCAKGFMAERGWTLGPIGFNFMNMIRKAYGKGWDYRPGTAPPRTRLKQFGGDLTIEQFRDHSDRFVCYQVPPNVVIETEQLAESGRQQQDQRREQRKKTIKRAQDIPVMPRKPRRLTMIRETPLPKKTYTLDTFWNR